MPPENKQEKKLVRLISAFSDINESGEAADTLLGGAPEELLQHLFLSFVASYARPFTENRGIGRILTDYPAFPDFADQEMNARHRR
jgi:hypothetical protein